MFMLAVTLGCVAAEASERWATLEAIHQLENPRNLTRPGRYGELGAYQFRPSTWRMHTQVPFQRALDRDMSDLIAVRHYDWLQRNLEAAGVPASPYNIALAWNGGLNATIAGRASAAAHNYASRAVNLAGVYAARAAPKTDAQIAVANATEPVVVRAAPPAPKTADTLLLVTATDEPTIVFTARGFTRVPRLTIPDFGADSDGSVRVALE